ncbi:FAD-dependent oxidoreductase [Streptomyces sp. NPDC001833]|uniref:NAD(P)/FAD-dependent oxidoreductase n=1 Tax=Streptomyces sp. NPDC001833 TaxID=3154658 RepID=UPI00331683BF
MTGHPRRVVVVGASAGGLATAEALRRQGYDGELVLVGGEPHLPYDRPPLSKQLLRGQWEPDRLALRTAAELDSLGLDLRLGTAAVGLDPGARLLSLGDGSRLPYDALVVATGVRPRRLTLPGADGPGAHVLRTLEDAQALRACLSPGRRLVIAGAGFVGTEAASVARGLGVDVTLVDPAPVPLAGTVGETVGRFVTDVHREHGVDLRTGATVAEIFRTGGRVTGVRLTDGAIVPADDVLTAVGSAPNTDWLAGSGLRTEDGLVCDRYCAAGPGVYGVGDVARWHNTLFDTWMRIEHRTNAAEQALTVAHNLLQPGAPRPFAPVPYFWTDQYDLRLQGYGHPRGHTGNALVEGDPAERRFVIAYRSADRLSAVVSVGMPPKTLRTWRAAVAARTPWHGLVRTVNGLGA